MNPRDATDALLDGDRDGLSNLDEYQADTDPADPASLFCIGSVKHTGEVEVSLLTSERRIYTLQYQELLGGGPWQDVAGQADVRGNGGRLVLRDLPVNRARFYRVRTALP